MTCAPFRIVGKFCVLRGKFIERGPTRKDAERGAPLVSDHGAKEYVFSGYNEGRVFLLRVVKWSTRVAGYSVLYRVAFYIFFVKAYYWYQGFIKANAYGDYFR